MRCQNGPALLNHSVARALGWEMKFWADTASWLDPDNENRFQCLEKAWNTSENWNQAGRLWSCKQSPPTSDS
jgi:hypothetical protein